MKGPEENGVIVPVGTFVAAEADGPAPETESTSPPVVFIAFPKIPRLKRGCVITEKIDGTNAVIYIGETGEFLVGSRNRWITPAMDNYGFAKWAYANKEELTRLGPGWHYGEWWGQGIQRRYGLSEKRFSLFNTHRWTDHPEFPACCSLVPTIAVGDFSSELVESALEVLRTFGSRAAPGFMDPEGVVVYLTAARQSFKVTIKNDEKPKGEES